MYTRVEFQSNLDGAFLKFSSFPTVLTTRNLLQGHLFIRDCYPDIMTEISTSLQSIGLKKKAVSIIGTAGIGKSSFFAYCLDAFLNNPSCLLSKNEDKSFYYQTGSQKVYFFSYNGRNSNDALEFDQYILGPQEVTDDRYPLFADLKDKIGQPEDHTGTILLFCSLSNERYKEVTKEGSWKLMPTWTTLELEAYICSEEFKAEFKATPEQCQKTYEASFVCGGKLRNCLKCGLKGVNPESLIDSALSQKGFLVAQNFFTGGFGGLEIEISDDLVHRNPLQRADGSFDYEALDKVVNFHFASPYVLNKIRERFKQEIVSKAKAKYAVGTFSGGSDGSEFELLCFHGFKFCNVIFPIVPLNGTTGLHKVEVVFPDMEVLTLDWKCRIDYLKPNVLYVPPYGNLESGDGFCVLTINGIQTLIILQCTIAENHPVKANGVAVIRKAMCDVSKVSVEDVILVFVTPSKGKLRTKQNIVSQKGLGLSRIDANVSSIKTKQFYMENELIPFDT